MLRNPQARWRCVLDKGAGGKMFPLPLVDWVMAIWPSWMQKWIGPYLTIEPVQNIKFEKIQQKQRELREKKYPRIMLYFIFSLNDFKIQSTV